MPNNLISIHLPENNYYYVNNFTKVLFWKVIVIAEFRNF